MSVYATLLDEIAKNIIPTILVPALVILSNIIYQYFLSEWLKLRKARNFWIKTTLRSNKSVDECINQFEDTVGIKIWFFLLQYFAINLAFFTLIFSAILFQNLVNTNLPIIDAGTFLIFPLIIMLILNRTIESLGSNKDKLLIKFERILNLNAFIWWFTFSYFFFWIIFNFNVFILSSKLLQESSLYSLYITSLVVFGIVISTFILSYSNKKDSHRYLQDFLNRKYHDNFPNILIKTDVGEFRGKIGSIFLTDLIPLLSIDQEQFIRWDSIKTISILTEDTVKEK